MAATLDAGDRRDRRDPAPGPRGRRARAAALADDRAAHAQGLDRPQGRRRPAGRGVVPLTPGAAVRQCATTRRTWRQLEEWLRTYEPERAVRRGRRPAPRARRARAERRAADGRQPARQRRPAAARRSSCPTSATTRSRSRAPRHDAERGHARARRLPARRDPRQPRPLPDHGARRDRVEPALGRLRGHRPRLGGRDAWTATITSRPTAG